MEVVCLSIMELWKHKQNNTFQSYGNYGVDTEVFMKLNDWVW